MPLRINIALDEPKVVALAVAGAVKAFDVNHIWEPGWARAEACNSGRRVEDMIALRCARF